VAGLFFDWVKDYTYIYLWSALFQFAAAALFFKVYLNWRQRSAIEQQSADAIARDPLRASPAPIR
jgi:hypothetical protein